MRHTGLCLTPYPVDMMGFSQDKAACLNRTCQLRICFGSHRPRFRSRAFLDPWYHRSRGCRWGRTFSQNITVSHWSKILSPKFLSHTGIACLSRGKPSKESSPDLQDCGYGSLFTGRTVDMLSSRVSILFRWIQCGFGCEIWALFIC